MQLKDAQIKDMQVTMPDTFEDKQSYIRKLQELIESEANIERLNTEVIAESNVEF